MQNPPVIGMTPGEIYNLEHPGAPLVHGQSHTYFHALWGAGADTELLPLRNDAAAIQRHFDKIDGLLLSGGNDIHPNLYGEEPYRDLEEPRFIRDMVEQQYLKLALEAGKPVFGICRGMQFINVYFGGTLYQDIPTDIPNALKHESSSDGKDMDSTDHLIDIEPDSKLCAILGTTKLDTNSYHHQAAKDVGEGLRVVARSSDGIVEALEVTDDRFIIGVQSHPESLITNQAVQEWRKMFAALTEQAAIWKAEHRKTALDLPHPSAKPALALAT